MQLTSQSVHSDIYFISSRRPKLLKNTIADQTFVENVANEREQIAYDIQRIEKMDRNMYLSDGFIGASISYIARRIEEKIEESFHCELCQSIFHENDKVQDCFVSSTIQRNACRSTYDICVTTDKYMRCHKWNDKSEFKIKYFLIFQEVGFEHLYLKSSFEEYQEHKFHLIKSIINEYTRIRGNQLSRKITTEEMTEILRKKLNKLVLSKGQ